MNNARTLHQFWYKNLSCTVAYQNNEKTKYFIPRLLLNGYPFLVDNTGMKDYDSVEEAAEQFLLFALEFFGEHMKHEHHREK